MAELQFSLKLAELSVGIIDEGAVQKTYKLKELTGAQRDIYLSTFNLDIEVVDGKPQIRSSEGFKTFPAVDFLAMCLYDENDKSVPEEKIALYPAHVVSELHAAALKLSGLDKESEQEAKND